MVTIISKITKVSLFLYYFILFLLTSTPGFNSLKYLYNSKNIQMYSEEDKNIVTFLSNSNYENLYLIGSRAWFYIFSNMNAQSSSNNWWFYLDPGFQTKGTLKAHKRYNLNPKKTIIAIDKRILNSDLNPYFYEIIDNSVPHSFETENFQFRLIKLK